VVAGGVRKRVPPARARGVCAVENTLRKCPGQARLPQPCAPQPEHSRRRYQPPGHSARDAGAGKVLPD